MLTGTLPVCPFDGTRTSAYGTVHGASGRPPLVLALATDMIGGIILLNLAGYKTACSSHGARIMVNGKLLFTPTNPADWPHEPIIQRLPGARYQELTAPIVHRSMVNYLTLPRSAHLTQGMQTVPTFPPPPKKDAEANTAEVPDAATSAHGALAVVPSLPNQHDDRVQTNAVDVSTALPRYIFGNHDEATPARATVDYALAALRVARYRDTRVPTAQTTTDAWIDALWDAGTQAELIVPMPAVGIRAWHMSGNLQAWATIVQVLVQLGQVAVPGRVCNGN